MLSIRFPAYPLFTVHTVDSLFAEINAIHAEISVKLDTIINSREKLTPHDEAPATIAEQQLALLRSSRCDFVLVPNPDLGPVLTVEQCDLLNLLKDNKTIVEFMRPIFSALFSDKGVVVNSEELEWLQTTEYNTEYNMKNTALFLAPEWAYTGHKFNAIHHHRFGSISDTRLYDSFYLFECECECTDKAFGELIIHLRDLNTHKKHKLSYGMLFGKSEFWLVKVQGAELIYRMVGKWTTDGSASCINNFFESFVWGGAVDICSMLNCVVPEPTAAFPCAFLGGGSYGRVLRVVLNDTHVALKVSLAEEAKDLYEEYARLKEHESECCCSLMVRAVTECVALPSGVTGFAMSPVGERSVSRVGLSKDKIDSIFRALHALHTHKPSCIYHGDPRLPNLIEMADKSLMWIDFSRAYIVSEPSNRAAIADVGILARSVLGISFHLPLPEAVEGFVEQCVCEITFSWSLPVDTAAAYMRVAEAVAQEVL